MRGPAFALVLLTLVAASSATVELPTCKYSTAARASTLFDIDLKYVSNRTEYVEWEFELQDRELDKDDCTVPGCCDPNAVFKFVELTMAPECSGTAAAGLQVLVDDKALPAADLEVNATAGSIKMKIPARPAGTARSVTLRLPPTSPCATAIFLKRGPCPSAGCAADLYVQDDKYVNCCLVKTSTNVDTTPLPTTAKLPLDLGVNVDDLPVTLLAIGDWGAPARYWEYTKFVAAGMDQIAKRFKAKGVVGLGDNFYENGLVYNKSAPPETFQAKISWEDVFMVYPSLHVPWWNVLGNHDYSYGVNASKYGLQACAARTQEECDSFPCCGSAALQYEKTGMITNKYWHLKNGTYTVPNVGGVKGLAELILFDTNPLVYKPTSSRSYVFGDAYAGVNSQDVDAIKSSLYSAVAASPAKWRIVVGHHCMECFGSHCVGSIDDGDPWLGVATRDCAKIQDVKLKLWEEGVPLYLNGHVHSAQFVKNASGPTFYVSSGNGYKQGGVQSMPPAVTTDLLFGFSKPLPREDGTLNYEHSDLGFTSYHIGADRLVVKFWGMGVDMAPPVPKNKLHLQYEYTLKASDLKRP